MDVTLRGGLLGRRYPVHGGRLFRSRQSLIDWHEPRADCWPDGGPLTVQAATDCLRNLSRLCCVEGHTTDSIKLRERLGLSANGLRMNDRASIVSVALHQTMCAYGIHSRSGEANGLERSCHEQRLRGRSMERTAPCAGRVETRLHGVKSAANGHAERQMNEVEAPS
jgi:hypothetical protein